MKAIKLSDTHYIVVDDSEIEDGICVRYILDVPYIMFYDKGVEYKQFKITHSTEPIDGDGTGACFVNIKPLSLSEIEEAIYGYSVEKMAESKYTYKLSSNARKKGFIEGFKAHQELTKDKLFTEKDVQKIIHWASLNEDVRLSEEEMFKSLLPKTEWNIEFDEQGKIKLIWQ